MIRFTAGNPEKVILAFLSRLVRCFPSGLCSVESGRWMIRNLGLQGEGGTVMGAASEAECQRDYRGFTPMIAWDVITFATCADTPECSYHFRCVWRGSRRV